MATSQSKKPVRHVLSLSGGKDSAALAIYMRNRVPAMEYIFNDTAKELPETYEYLDRIADYLGRPIKRLNADFGFDHWYAVYGKMIPSNHRRWCTKMLKLKPFEAYVGDDPVLNYLGLRADEDRKGYISHKPNIAPVYPFQDDGLVLSDIEQILTESGIGLPPYTTWGRSRSGCFFCFYQQRIEWVRLKEHHPHLYEEAKKYEHAHEEGGNVFTWIQGESLTDLERPERTEQIKRDARRNDKKGTAATTLKDLFSEEDRDSASGQRACLICEL